MLFIKIIGRPRLEIRTCDPHEQSHGQMFVKYKIVEFYVIIIFRCEKENCLEQFFTMCHVIFSGVIDRETPLRLTGRQ